MQRLLVALAMGLVAAGCGGGSGDSAAPPPVGDRAGRLAASKPGEVVAFVRKGLADRAAARNSGGGTTLVPLPASAAAPSAGGDAAVPFSGTLVQEVGIDEEDLIKTDGQWVFSLDLHRVDANGRPLPTLDLRQRQSDGSLAAAVRLPLPAETDRTLALSGLHLAASARRVVALGSASRPFRIDCPPGQPCVLAGVTTSALLPVPGLVASEVALDVVDVTQPESPALAARLRLDGRLVGSRRIGDRLVLVTRHAPALAVDALPPDTTAQRRAEAIAAVTADDVLPRLRIDAGPSRPLVAETDCYLLRGDPSLAIEVTTITTIDLASPGLDLSSRCHVGGSEALYMAPTALYLATTRFSYQTAPGAWPYPADISTEIHQFALQGGRIDYRASGSVRGHLGWDPERKSMRLGEHNGDLRVISFTGETGWGPQPAAGSVAPSPATLTILRPQGDVLEVVSTLPNARRPAPLGRPGEQLFGVRFLGERALAVTFRITDPLYVLDLSDPADPKIAGELEVPGFSDHLVPLGDDLVLGVGKEADARGLVQGVKVALLDIANPAAPRQIDARVYGERGSVSGLDVARSGLNLLRVGSSVRIAMPMQLLQGSTWQQGLHRFEVSLATRSMTLRPVVLPLRGAPPGTIETDRSVQIGDHVHYLSSGDVATAAW